MKRMLVMIISLLFISGCTLNNASEIVTNYLNKYKNLDSSVISQIDDLIDKEELNDEQKKVYKQVIERQYKDMEYRVVSEIYDGKEAYVTMQVRVYDYYMAQKKVASYLKDNRDKFYKDGIYDEDAYVDYKLDTMKKYNEKITYNVDFKLSKDGNMWKVNDLKESELEKIHGIYDYSND